jgi:O-antigen biosynthesis protein
MSRRKKNKKKSSPPVKTIVDIVIPVLKRFDLLEKCLASIPDAMGDIPYKVYIYDNGSPKEEADAFYSQLDRSTIIVTRSDHNRGFPIACNEGVKRGRSEYVFLLNSDIVLYPNSVNILVRDMQENPNIGILGMKLLFPEDQVNDPIRPAGKIQHVGLFTNIRAEIIHAFVGWSSNNPRPNKVREAYAVTGAALMTRRNIWIKAGGLLEDYGLGTFEDVDFCMTVREMGYEICVNVNAVADHYTNATAVSEKIAYPMQRNSGIFLSRWREKLLWTEWSVL